MFKIGDEVVYIKSQYYGHTGKIVKIISDGEHVVLDNMHEVAPTAFGTTNLVLKEIFESPLFQALKED